MGVCVHIFLWVEPVATTTILQPVETFPSPISFALSSLPFTESMFVAEAVGSSFLGVLIDKLIASPLLEYARRKKDDDEENATISDLA